MSLATLIKAPGDVLDYDVSFIDWLMDDDRITDWDAAISGSTAQIDRGDYTDKSVRLWVSGGHDGDTAHVDLTVTTFAGRIKNVCFRIRVRECK